MREIKFRAYNKENKKVALEIDMSQNPMNWAGELHADWELMQFTGLKDKNGLDVYEGDLILAPSVEWKIPVGDYECTVEWEGSGFYAKHENGVGEGLENLIEVRGGVVIGNIWEGKKEEGNNGKNRTDNQIIMDSPLRDMWKKIKHWYWWNIRATEKEKVAWDTIVYGTGFMMDGKRINPKNFISKQPITREVCRK